MSPCAPASGTALVIGVGQPDRGDDSVGPRVADHFAADPRPGVEVLRCRDDLTVVLDRWAAVRVACVIDAVAPGGHPGRVYRWEGKLPPAGRGAGGMSAHVLSLEQAVELGRALGQLPQRLVVFGVEAVQVEVGRGLSPEVEGALPEVIARVGDELRVDPRMIGPVTRAGPSHA